MGRRYLTPAEKAKRLDRWHQERSDPEDTYPDPEVYELTDHLNAIEGVCTVQSCYGHPDEVVTAAGVEQYGYLWLRLSEAMTKLFLVHAPALADMQPEIAQVSLVFGPPSGEIVDIVFKTGPEAFAQASILIVDFFLRLEAVGCLRLHRAKIVEMTTRHQPATSHHTRNQTTP